MFRNPRRTLAGVSRPVRAGRSQGRRRSSASGRARRSWRSAAIQAVIDGTEQVTRKSMDPIPVDIASQEARPGKGKP